eukprot:TRINITY_DN106_c0_g1_i4.p1 TRINITY_DN106_c0_g1~~TRINITY_DN106_c0_g1_i4.p1  ORF type:complete len:216 (+),score=55.49 TRINITY_DN106_c0_g1_i4:208-855(+)
MTVSFVGTEAFASALGTKTYNVYVTQCVPLPSGTSPVAQKFRTALAAYDSTVEPGFVNLEGYISGRLVAEAFTKMESSIGSNPECADITAGEFLSVFASRVRLSVDDIVLGPYGADVCNDVAELDCGCNQGMRQVFLSRMKGSNIERVPFDFSFSTCGFQAIVPTSPSNTSSDDMTIRVSVYVTATVFCCLNVALVVTITRKMKTWQRIFLHKTM